MRSFLLLTALTIVPAAPAFADDDGAAKPPAAKTSKAPKASARDKKHDEGEGDRAAKKSHDSNSDSDGEKEASYAGGVAKESAKTAGGAVRDGSRSVGRTIRSFFKEGPDGAKKTWKDNAKVTKENAKAGAKKTDAAANAK
jgi:hypothetical protein